MKFHYLIAAYNEADALLELVMKLSVIPARFPGSQVLIVDNASTDDSKKILTELNSQFSWLKVYYEKEKGLGIAFRRGLQELSQLKLTKEDWIAFNAADLPFDFSDLDSFLDLYQTYPRCCLFVGSKSHPQSQVNRNWKRILASQLYRIFRSFLLNMKTRDPQGTLFLRGDQISVVEKIGSKDYFFTTELVYFMERKGPVIEMPVKLNSEFRPSKVRLLADGYRALKQILKLYCRKGD